MLVNQEEEKCSCLSDYRSRWSKEPWWKNDCDSFLQCFLLVNWPLVYTLTGRVRGTTGGSSQPRGNHRSVVLDAPHRRYLKLIKRDRTITTSCNRWVVEETARTVTDYELWSGRAGSWLQICRLNSRKNQWKFKTAGKVPIILEKFIEEYTPIQ